jgi:hypothetical protein
MDAAETDVFGPVGWPPGRGMVLSVAGVRRLRGLVAGMDRVETGRARPWKVVRHAHGADPYMTAVEVCSAHSSREAAERARVRARAKMVRRQGHEAAAVWVWSVVCDHAGLVSVERVRR